MPPPALTVRTRATHARLVASAPATPYRAPAGAGRLAPSLLEDIAAALSPRYLRTGAGSSQLAPPSSPTAAAPALAADLEADLEAAGALPLAGAQPQPAGPAKLSAHLVTAPVSPAAAAAAERGGRGRALVKRPSLIEDTASSQPDLQETVRVSLQVTSPRAQPPWHLTPSARGAPHHPPPPLSLPSSPLAMGASWTGQHPARYFTLELYPHLPPESAGSLPRDWYTGSRWNDSAELRQPLLQAAPLGWRTGQQAEALQWPAIASGKGSSVAAAAVGCQGYPYATIPLEYAVEPEYAPQEEYALLDIQYGPPHHWLTPYALASISAAALAALALGLIFSVRFTQAHWCQLVSCILAGVG